MIDKEIEVLAYQKLLEVDKNVSNEFVSFTFFRDNQQYEASASWNGYNWIIYNIVESK